jgi:hypothetical protein
MDSPLNLSFSQFTSTLRIFLIPGYPLWHSSAMFFLVGRAAAEGMGDLRGAGNGKGPGPEIVSGLLELAL